MPIVLEIKLEKKYKIAVIGASGFIGKNIVKEARKKGFSILEVTSQMSRLNEKDVVVWKYDMPLPEICQKTSVVINCAYSWENQSIMSLFKYLVHSLHPKQKLIHLSTYAIKTKPKSFFSKIFFSGDDYIRTKKRIDDYLRKNVSPNQLSIVYPTVVLGAGGSWDNFFKSLENRKVYVPHGGKINCKKVDVDALSSKMIDYIQKDDLGPLNNMVISDDKNETWKDIMVRKCKGVEIAKNDNKNIFCEGLIKNMIFSTLCLSIIPDFIAIKIFKFLRRLTGQKNKGKNSCSFVKPEGMTRFYMTF